MDFTFSEDQRLFAGTLRDILSADCPPEAVRASWEDPDARVPGLWETLGGTGLLGLTAPGSHEGLGMDAVDLVLLLEELGRAASPEPVAEHVAVAVPLIRDHGSAVLRDTWLGRAATGDVVLTAGSPVDDLVRQATAAWAEGVDVLLWGHFHTPWICTREGRTALIVPAWLESGLGILVEEDGSWGPVENTLTPPVELPTMESCP
jgi:hypothetical protein